MDNSKPRINLKAKDIMEMYGVSRSTISRWLRKGLPYVKFGHQLMRFDADLVEQWLCKHHKESEGE